MRLVRRIGLLVLAGVFAMGVVSCASAGEAMPGSTAPPSPVAEKSSGQTAADSEEESEAPDPEPSAAEDACEDQGETTDFAVIPDQLDDLDVPFYPCVREMVAMTGSDPLFVGEYDTHQASIIVEMSIKDQFDASEWEVTERSVAGDNAITKAQKPGYSLVVAIGPSRTPGAESSIHYTLHER